MLGAREPKHYGSLSLSAIEENVAKLAAQHDVNLECFQANSEEKLIDKIHQSFQKVDFILINPAAYTHTSVALRDALLAVSFLCRNSFCLMYINASHSVIILTLVMWLKV